MTRDEGKWGITCRGKSRLTPTRFTILSCVTRYFLRYRRYQQRNDMFVLFSYEDKIR